MHYVSVMKIRKIRELQLTNVRTLLIQIRLGPNGDQLVWLVYV